MGRSGAFNCNVKKGQYEKSGIEKINHSDHVKRNLLINDVLPCLVIEGQNIGSIKSDNARCFGKGIVPARKCNAGGPREQPQKVLYGF